MSSMSVNPVFEYLPRAAAAEFLRCGPRVVLDRCLAAGVDRVAVGVGGEQGADDRHDAATVGHRAARLLDEEERRFRVGGEALVVVAFGDLQNRLLDHDTGGVDRDVDAAEAVHRFIEQPDVVADHREVALDRECIGALGFQRSDGGVRIGFRRRAVVVDRDAASAGIDERMGDQCAQILAAAGDDGDLAGESSCRHGRISWKSKAPVCVGPCDTFCFPCRPPAMQMS